MGSRALRKLQKGLRQNDNDEAIKSEFDELDLNIPTQKRQHQDLYSLLQTEEDDHSENSEEQTEEQLESENDHSSSHQLSDKVDNDASVTKKKNKKNRKKKKISSSANAEGKDRDGSTKASERKAGKEEDDDDLDALLQSLSTSQVSRPDASSVTSNPYATRLQELLSVESKHLHASNEIRKLFGSSAVAEELGEENAGQQAGRRGRAAGRHGPRQQTLSSVSLTRNVFVQGKEGWPRATSGGLGMEVEKNGADDTVVYKFVHSRGYQDVQMQFLMCVESMDPERLVQLLHFNRWSTLAV